MPINSEISFSKCFSLPNPGLRTYFGRVVAGQPDEFRTPFYEGKDVTQVLAEWMPHLQSLKDEWPTLLEFENDLAKKVGPMSIMAPLSQRMKDIDSYYESILLDSEPIDYKAIAAVCNEWKRLGGLLLRSEEATVEKMKLSTNSGSPYFSTRKAVLKKTVPSHVKFLPSTMYDGGNVIQYLPGKDYHACAILGWRGQEGGPKPEDVKQRVVWMFPFAVNVQELRLYQPLIEGAQALNLVPAWVSMDAVDLSITRLFDTKDPDDVIVCTDFSKFDQHFNKSMQDAAYEVIKYLLTDNERSRSWLKDVFPIKYNIPLAYNWKKVRFGAHGMGSGSGGTNADETLAHRALQHEVALKHRKILNPNSMCLGDDGILSYPGITAKDVMQSYTTHGLEMNLDKQYESTQDCTYLRRWHHVDYRINGVCVGVYSTARALGRLCEQERYYDHWSKEMVALRQLSILENIKYHPLKEEFVDFCMKGDKFRLGLDIPGFLDNLVSYAKEANDYMPDFLGYTKSLQNKEVGAGINDWWIVNYLRSKA
nr:MAG: RNA-dependent RNA polymerase [Porcine picobirnavirus]